MLPVVMSAGKAYPLNFGYATLIRKKGLFKSSNMQKFSRDLICACSIQQIILSQISPQLVVTQIQKLSRLLLIELILFQRLF